jgi:phosphoglycerate dehydrogenase-like enzyme
MPAEMVDRHLPETVLLLGQTDMPRERIERAPRLKAIFNVETNFLPNIDYVACRDHGVWVLSPTSAFAEAGGGIGARHGDRFGARYHRR